MTIPASFLDLFVNATEKAAYGASKFIGKGDKIAADKGAVDPLRNELNKIDMYGTVVIGEGEMDEAPMLYIGEQLGTLTGPKFDIAVDPLEGTKFTANNEPNAFSVLVVAEKGNLLSAPDTYMEKIAIGSIFKIGICAGMLFKVLNFSMLLKLSYISQATVDCCCSCHCWAN